MTTPETWRVVLDDGTVREVTTYPVTWGGALRWALNAEGDGPFGRTPRNAIATLALSPALWLIVEIRAPGEPTTDERIAAAVAAETARCVAVCEKRAKYYRDEAAEWARRGYTSEIHSRESAALCLAEMLRDEARND